jgi:hypothetical protein
MRTADWRGYLSSIGSPSKITLQRFLFGIQKENINSDVASAGFNVLVKGQGE